VAHEQLEPNIHYTIMDIISINKRQKYECKTGPLEGIVVGSVEYCDKEFTEGLASPS